MMRALAITLLSVALPAQAQTQTQTQTMDHSQMDHGAHEMPQGETPPAADPHARRSW